MSADQPTVLVVEDELAQREVLAYNLEAEGFRVVKAGNGDDRATFVICHAAHRAFLTL